MHLPLPLLLLLTALLGAWFTWLDVRRPDRRHLIWRLLASWGVVACLVLFLTPPKITRTYNASEAILLTEGYHADTLNALLKRLRPKPQVYAFGVPGEKAGQVTDLASFQRQHPSIKTLHILGYGLSAEELATLDSLRLKSHLSDLPAGVLTAFWPQEITLGDAVSIQGRFHGLSEEKLTLYLQAAGKSLDSAEIRKGVDQTFFLRFTPKTAGRFVYALQWKDTDDSLHQENLPVIVRAPRQLNILLLSSAPSFEGKFLKNALAQRGHSVAVRNQVSQGIYSTEWVNLPAQNLNLLTPALLQKFDVVLLDDGTLQQLGVQEKQALQQAVRQQGLGVLTSVSQKSPKPTAFFTEGVFRLISEKPARSGVVRWQKQTGAQAVLPLSNTVLQPKEGQQPLAWEQNPSQAVVVRSRKGLGQVGISLLPETFPLALEGKETLYQQYWATVLTSLAKPEEENTFHVTSEWLTSQVHHPITFSFSSASLKLRSLQDSLSSSSAFYTQTSTLVPDLQLGQNWPQKTGWYHVQSPEGTRFLYVYPKNAWKLNQLAKNQKILALRMQKRFSAQMQTSLERQEPLPLWLPAFLLLFLLTYLWLKEKI
ncbi:hypothetical protein [Rufibacter latericius]|uniref:Uncharacterized protein n=1 Tax=Rufibacter latericius TaxID=2487040 RepID=A0A3M9MFX9_9BACT|nr:hypothetical protein [Rufibacter latericius]RNI23538.1 hypothetical protein EFB08_18585 [Rufibacter latericius]